MVELTIDELTVNELRKALDGVPGELKVKLSNNTGVSQGVEQIIVKSAKRINRINYEDSCGPVDYFEIYVKTRKKKQVNLLKNTQKRHWSLLKKQKGH